MAEVVLMRFPFRHDAEFAQGYLHEVGIPARVASDDAGGVDLSISFLSGASLFVPAHDVDRAIVTLRVAGVLEGE
jgi:hypothetical protein